MTQTASNLEDKIDSIESKADRYETATNFEAKEQEYRSGLSSIESSLERLQRRVERMEFLNAVLLDVLKTRQKTLTEVRDARDRALTIVDNEADEYYELVDEKNADSYKQRVQQTLTTVGKAVDALESELRQKETTWTNRVDAARNVQRLFGDSVDMTPTFNKIESFVTRRMKDDSESINTLKNEWQGLKKKWDKSGVDWESFQDQYGLSNRSIEILKELAEGEELKLERLDESTMSELLSIDDLQDVAKITL